TILVNLSCARLLQAGFPKPIPLAWVRSPGESTTNSKLPIPTPSTWPSAGSFTPTSPLKLLTLAVSHRLLAQDDLAMPLDIYDKKAGIDYFTAETALAKIFRPELVAGSTTATLSFNPNQLP